MVRQRKRNAQRQPKVNLFRFKVPLAHTCKYVHYACVCARTYVCLSVCAAMREGCYLSRQTWNKSLQEVDNCKACPGQFRSKKQLGEFCRSFTSPSLRFDIVQREALRCACQRQNGSAPPCTATFHLVLKRKKKKYARQLSCNLSTASSSTGTQSCDGPSPAPFESRSTVDTRRKVSSRINISVSLKTKDKSLSAWRLWR